MRPGSLIGLMVSLAAGPHAFAAGEGKILRPADRSALPSADLDIVATAPAGRLELDGQPIAAGQPFPNVFHARLQSSPGVHQLSLAWEGGRQDIQFYCGSDPPAGFAAFHPHPPLAGVECAACHELTKRGRFHFKGGEACLGCHQTQTFAKVHTHTPDVLNQCGLCHNAHGSTVKAHLLFPQAIVCKQCHD